jgi:ectoine hydroxylase-related dioxygenase (phytanoyl-CoA dioxygenase family)
MIPGYVESIELHGFAIAPNAVSSETKTSLIDELRELSLRETAISRRQSVYSIRNLLRLSPAIHELANSSAIRSFVEPVLGPDVFAVRAIYFDKTPENNWPVAWHQDVAVPIKHKIAVAGFGPWTIKTGILHALAPAWVLEKMLTIRLHLDETTLANGALRVIPGSHRQGRLSPEEIRTQAAQSPAIACEVAAGDILAMRPLLLHASSPALHPSHRRVLHLEFASHQLPEGLEWNCA